VLGLEGVDQAQTNEVGQAHLDRHGATVGRAAVTQAVAVTGPGVATVNVNNGDGGSHGRGNGQAKPQV
jgi:hypothetical protein